MACISLFNPYPCKKTLSVKPPTGHLSSKKLVSTVQCTQIMLSNSKSLMRGKILARTMFQIHATGYGDELSRHEGESGEALEEEQKEVSEVDILKKELMKSFYGTDRGSRTSSETRADITELTAQLEAKNPTPSLAEDLTPLNGKWNLLYTSFPPLLPLLLEGIPSLLKVEEFSETIDSDNSKLQLSLQFAGPLASTSEFPTHHLKPKA
ncbi:hypothetical protein IFM89_022297 [Coptis chinensis]|uniref:Plastid lipid-associated protein/fibrillin conserved domain-containing protein n=1 Tax=Coptis chinensis TaxID=261450 RepID=A0A835I4C7_9MAGN|nr:hypothetical protein IFM89_022297 [Coptis chinensis]